MPAVDLLCFGRRWSYRNFRLYSTQRYPNENRNFGLYAKKEKIRKREKTVYHRQHCCCAVECVLFGGASTERGWCGGGHRCNRIVTAARRAGKLFTIRYTFDDDLFRQWLLEPYTRDVGIGISYVSSVCADLRAKRGPPP